MYELVCCFLQINDDDDEEEEEEGKPTRNRKPQQSEEKDKTQELQRALLDYLVYNAQNDPALVVMLSSYKCFFLRKPELVYSEY